MAKNIVKHELSGASTVLVDMDGVGADFETPNNDIVRTYFPDIAVIQVRQEFYYKDTYPEPISSKIDEMSRMPGFFLNFPVVEGAIDGWSRILAAGYTPRICSSPLENHDTVIAEKIAWLEEHFVPVFGAWVIDMAIFDRDKSGYDAIAMIDDRPTLRNMEKAAWQHIIFSRSYNLAVDTKFRLLDWYDPCLEDLLLHARQQYITSR